MNLPMEQLLFIVFAAVLTLLFVAWVLRPLWRDAASRSTAIVVGALVVAAAIGLYMWSSRWTWPVESASADNPAAMVSRLARRLEREPNDVAGWLMLGRSYAALNQLPLAQRAYQRADRLENGRNAEALIGLGEAMVLQADGAVDPRAARVFEQALALEPNSEKALFFAAIGAQRRGDTALAIARFEKMLTLGPPENIRSILQEQIDKLRKGETTENTTPSVRVAVSVGPDMLQQVKPGSTLFVFVRAPGRPGPPLAVKRVPAKLPLSVELTAADSMVPGLSFAANDTVEVSAKISADGNATPRSGDPVGSVSYVVGQDKLKAVVIDRLSP